MHTKTRSFVNVKNEKPVSNTLFGTRRKTK